MTTGTGRLTALPGQLVEGLGKGRVEGEAREIRHRRPGKKSVPLKGERGRGDVRAPCFPPANDQRTKPAGV